MKRKIMAIAVIIMTTYLAVVANQTSAYFTYEDKAHNVITSGNIEIELIEMMESEEGLIPFEDQTGVMPGAEISKIVTVKNTGGQPAYIRVSVDKSIILADGTTDGVDLTLVSCDFNYDKWTEKDGFYYYNNVLDAGAETEPLFTTVTFAKEMGNKYQNCTAEIDVQAQATQVANNGTNVFEALGWPVE